MRFLRSLFPLLVLSSFALPARAQDQDPEDAPALPAEAMRHAAEIERANALIQSGNAAEAVAILRAIAEQDLAELGEENPFVVKAFSNLSYALSAAGDHDEARTTAYRALEIARAQGEPSVSTAMVKRNLAEIAERMGEIAEAQVWIEDACRDLEGTFGRTPMAAETREIAARIAFALSDLDAAQDHLERALAIHERFLGIANETTARPLAPLASILAQRGQLRSAVFMHQTMRRVLEASGAGGSPAWQDAVQGEIGLLLELGELALAQDAARLMVGEGPDAESSAEERFDGLLRAAAIYMNAGDARTARSHLERALGLVPELPEGEIPQELRCLVPLAQARLLCRDAAGALEALDRAGQHDLEALDPALAVEMELLRARTLLALDRAAEAREILVIAFQKMRELAGEQSPALRELCFELLRCEDRTRGASVAMVDLVDMIEAPLASTTPASLARSMRGGWERGETSFQGALVQGWLRLAEKDSERTADAFAALERARARSELASLAWRVESAEALEHPALRSHLAALRAIEAGAQSQSDDGESPELRDSGSRFERLLAEHGASLDQARSLLEAEDHVIVQYLWTDADAWAFVVAREAEQDALVHLASCAKLAPMLAASQEALRDLEKPCDLTALAKELLHPVLANAGAVARATIVADGPLAFVPFEALPLPGGEPWVERCRIAYAPSVSALLAQRAATASSEKIVHVGPIVDHGAVTLSHEVTALRTRFAVQPGSADKPDIGEVMPEGEVWLASEQARESALFSESAKGRFAGARVLELRVPAYVDAQVPSASGLVLTPESTDDGKPGWRRPNGFLDLGELATLDLGAELVLLPVAEVGPRAEDRAMRSEGLNALVSSFFRAGARTIALTSFTTGDNRARLFDRSVLEHARAADAPAEALGNAQRAWLQRARSAGDRSLVHPGIWARWRAFGR